MQTLAEIKEMLASRGLSPQHRFGQNFLIDHNLIRKLVDAAGVAAGDVVLEVGPGTGVLTEELLERGCDVVACDIDRGLCALLRERLGGHARWSARFTLVEGDCLAGKHELSPLLREALQQRGAFTRGFRLVANLPYGAATPLMMILLARDTACAGLFVTIQREVGERLLARASTKEYGPLSVLAQVCAEVELIAKLPPHCFWPAPDVTSAMVALRRRGTPLHPRPAELLDWCQSLFEQRRKQLGGVLRGMGYDAALLGEVLQGPWSAQTRAEALSVEQLIALHQRLGAARSV